MDASKSAEGHSSPAPAPDGTMLPQSGAEDNVVTQSSVVCTLDPSTDSSPQLKATAGHDQFEPSGQDPDACSCEESGKAVDVQHSIHPDLSNEEPSSSPLEASTAHKPAASLPKIELYRHSAPVRREPRETVVDVLGPRNGRLPHTQSDVSSATATRQRLALALSRTSVMSVAEVPKGTVRAATVVAANAILMATVEIIIEVLVLTGVYPKLPFRLDFFFLTMLSGLLGFHVVRGMMQDHFDTSMNALQVSALVELALIAGDIKFMVEQGEKYKAAIPTRVVFAILTGINLNLVVYLGIRLLRYHEKRKKWVLGGPRD